GGAGRGLYLPGGGARAVERGPLAGGCVATPAQGRPDARPHLARRAEKEARPTGDRWYQVLIDEQVTQFVGGIPPGRAPDHYHQYEEVLVILSGRGLMWAGRSSAPIAAGSCFYLPRRPVHRVPNNRSHDPCLLGLFYPAG